MTDFEDSDLDAFLQEDDDYLNRTPDNWWSVIGALLVCAAVAMAIAYAFH